MAEFQVQSALYTALSGIGLTVYDVQPQATDGGAAGNFPSVNIGTIVFADWDVKEKTGFDFVARIHTFSRTGSMREAKLIQGQMYDRLHLGEINIAGYSLVSLRRESSDVVRETGKTFHGICEYRGLIEKAA